jgi:hypothetical protein
MLNLIVGGETDVEIPDLQDTTDHSYPQNATVVCTLYDAAGAPVTGATALPMPFAAGSGVAGGTYRGVIPHTAPLVVNASYTLRVTVTDTSGNVRPFTRTCGAIDG